jgi:hypothetical protein
VLIGAAAVVGVRIKRSGEASTLLKTGSVLALLKSGPLFPKVFNLSNFEVKAVTRGDWPVFVVYELPQRGVVTLTIKADQVDPFVHRLEGTPGRHEVKFTIPARFGDKLRAGSYALVAVSDDSSAATPIEFRLYGIAVGDAVGSLGVDSVSFKPDRVVATQRKGKADYSFHSLFDFKKVRADFRQIYRVRGVTDTRLVAEKVINKGIRRDAWHQGEWDCREGNKVSKGLHELHVLAWNGGGWVAGVSEQVVDVQ